MNLKTTYILFGVLLVALIVFAVTQLGGVKSGGGDKDQYVFADFNSAKDPVKSSDVDQVRLERPADGKVIAFTHDKDGWLMTEPFTARTDAFQVDNLVREVTGARREKSEMSTNLKEYDLDPPPLVVTIKKGEQEWKMNVGKSSAGASAVVYVSNAATPNRPMAVRKSGLESVFKKANDFRSRELLTATAANATAVQLDAKSAALALDKTSDGRWRFVKPAYGPANFEGETPAAPPVGEKKINGVRDLIDTVGGLRVEADNDFVAEGASDADLAEKYGLAKDSPETLRIETKVKPLTGDEKTETLLVGKKAPKADEKKDDAKPAEKPDYYFVRLAGEKSVQRVPAAKLKPLLDAIANADPLRSRDLVTVAGAAKIDAVDVKAGTSDVTLRQVDNKWTLYHGGARATDGEAVRELIDALTGDNSVSHKKTPPVKTFVDKDDGLEFDKPAAVVAVWIDGVKKPEKKDEEKKEEKKDEPKDKMPELKSDKPTVTLTFGKRDKDKGIVYVRRESDGDRSIVTVSDTLLDRVTSSYLTYLDRKLPTFTDGPMPADAAKDVTKLTLQRSGQTWALTRTKDGDKTIWKFAQPQALADRVANEAGVTGLLLDLSALQAEKIVDEKPSDTNLDQIYGLKNPETKVTVAVQKGDKSEDWVYSFGKQDEKKNGVFAQLNKTDLVFLVPRLTVDHLGSAELRDLTVFNFDMKQVKGAKITVWSNDLGSPITLDLERKGDRDWAKKGGPLDPDGAKVENFLRTLSSLHATKFVTPRANTDTGLDVNKKALKVEITTEGGALELLVGNEDSDNKGQLFASSSKLPGDVFLVPELLFKDAKASPAYFRK